MARSVVRIQIPGGGICSGTLINNTAQDGTVYIITAGHCLDDALDRSDYTIEFNYEVSCGGSYILKNHKMSGGNVVVFDNTIDIGLIKMNDKVPDNFNAYFSGWDLSLLESTKTHALIHHKAGYPKSIAIAPGGRTFEKSNYYNPTPRGDYYQEKFFTNSWSVGDMGGGSSGAGLFYDNEYYVGTLNGPKTGTPNLTCENPNNINEVIRYTPIGHVWVNNIIERSNLKTYLDPLNTGVQKLEGKEASDGDGGDPNPPTDCINVDLAITFDRYARETSWTITNNEGSTVASSPAYSDADNETQINVTECLTPGTYTLTFSDTFGDGMCCSYGTGSYALSQDNKILASGGEFTSSETTEFTIGDQTRDGIINQPISSTQTEQKSLVSPNPFTEYLNLTLAGTTKDELITVSLFNITGQKLYSTTLSQGNHTLYLDEVLPTTSGYYFLKTFSSQKTEVFKLLKK